MASPFVHIELSTTDPTAAKAFYAQLFGWTLSDVQVPVGAYTLVDSGAEPSGGIMQQMMPNAGSAWMPYVLVGNIAASTAAAKALGAVVLKDVDEVPGRGWLSIIEDPTGALLGLWQAIDREQRSGADS